MVSFWCSHSFQAAEHVFESKLMWLQQNSCCFHHAIPSAMKFVNTLAQSSKTILALPLSLNSVLQQKE